MRNSLEKTPSPPVLKGSERPGPPPLLSEKQLRNRPGFSIFIGLFAVVAFCLVVWFGIYKDNIINSGSQLPVVTANDTPIRVRPTEPGGMQIPHQDKLILKELVDGEKQSTMELLLPKPEVPLRLDKDASANSKAVIKSNAVQSMKKNVPASQKQVPLKLGEPRNFDNEKKITSELRRGTNVKRKATQEKISTANRKKLSSAKYRVQLASVKSDELARKAWKRYRQKFAKSLGTLELYIEKVLIPSKGTFHRVQAGVLNKTKAQKLCSVLINKKQQCIITPIKSGGV